MYHQIVLIDGDGIWWPINTYICMYFLPSSSVTVRTAVLFDDPVTPPK